MLHGSLPDFLSFIIEYYCAVIIILLDIEQNIPFTIFFSQLCQQFQFINKNIEKYEKCAKICQQILIFDY